MILLLIIALIALDVLLVAWFTERREYMPFWSLMVLAASVAVFHFLIIPIDFLAVLHWLKWHKTFLVMFGSAYVVSGIIWSFYRWFIYLKDHVRSSLKDKERIINNKLVWKETAKGTQLERYNIEIEELKNTPLRVITASDNKGRIITWMIYWPFSLIGVLATKPVTRFYNFLFKQLSSTFDTITKKAYGKHYVK